jgi:hypothetical protein
VAHFAVYAAVVFVVSPLGLPAVAVGASVVHTAFLVVAYVLMLSGTPERPLRRLWADVSPASCSSVALAAVAVPVAMALSAAGTPTFVLLAAVSVAGAAAYLLALRVVFAATWRSLTGLVGQVLPARSRRALSRRVSPKLETVATHE